LKAIILPRLAFDALEKTWSKSLTMLSGICKSQSVSCSTYQPAEQASNSIIFAPDGHKSVSNILVTPSGIYLINLDAAKLDSSSSNKLA